MSNSIGPTGLIVNTQQELLAYFTAAFKSIYGNDINLAFMEVNEKVDGAMNNLPRNLERPRIIKALAVS